MKYEISDYLKKMKAEGKYDSFAWPGGYEMHYLTADGGVLCATCANENASLTNDPDDKQWFIIAYEVHLEGPAITCDHCNKQIEAEYGNPFPDEAEA